MKGKLEFNLPEEENEFKIASNAMDWALVAWDMAEYLRDELKYNSSDLDSGALEKIQDIFFGILENRNLTLEIIQ